MPSPSPSTLNSRIIHATAVEKNGQCVLLQGASGSGKSDLALRLLKEGFRLVADDRVSIRPENEAVFASSPEAIAGLLEVRGVGIVEIEDPASDVPVALVIDLSTDGAYERMPEPVVIQLMGARLPRYALDPFESSAPLKVDLLLRLVLKTQKKGSVADS